MFGDRAGSGVVVCLGLLLVVGPEQVVVVPVDPLPVERAELVVEVVLEAVLVEEQLAVLVGQKEFENLVAKRG